MIKKLPFILLLFVWSCGKKVCPVAGYVTEKTDSTIISYAPGKFYLPAQMKFEKVVPELRGIDVKQEITNGPDTVVFFVDRSGLVKINCFTDSLTAIIDSLKTIKHYQKEKTVITVEKKIPVVSWETYLFMLLGCAALIGGLVLTFRR